MALKTFKEISNSLTPAYASEIWLSNDEKVILQKQDSFWTWKLVEHKLENGEFGLFEQYLKQWFQTSGFETRKAAINYVINCLPALKADFSKLKKSSKGAYKIEGSSWYILKAIQGWHFVDPQQEALLMVGKQQVPLGWNMFFKTRKATLQYMIKNRLFD